MSNGSLVLVVGMHRSGTSAAVRVLQLVGASLGDESRLMDARPDNPRGFWESRDVSHLNDRLLLALGGSWDRPPRPWCDWAGSTAMEPWLGEAKQLIARLVEDAQPVHAVKDPRFCLTLPLWLRAAPDARLLIPFRDPLSVAQSLERRNGIPVPDGIYLWMAYMRALFAHITSMSDKPVLVDYHDLLADPMATSWKLVHELGLPEPTGAQRVVAAESVESQLNHAEPLSGPTPPGLPEADMVYQALKLGDLQQAKHALAAESRRQRAAPPASRDDPEPEVILHIGAESRVSSMLPDVLLSNRGAMLAAKVLYPESLGARKHWPLQALAMDSDRGARFAAQLPEDFVVNRGKWTADLRAALAEEMAAADAEQVIFSNESLHYALRSEREIHRLKSFLASAGGSMRVVVYLQRQDRAMVSRWLAALERGNSGDHPFLPGALAECDYEQTLERWARIFGQEAIVVRVVEDIAATGRDFVEDFVLAARLKAFPSEFQRSSSPELLSERAQHALREFDRASRRAPQIQVPPSARRTVAQIAAEIFPGSPTSPFMDAARAVFARFEAENSRIAQRWLGREKLFDEDFSEYSGSSQVEEWASDGYILAARLAATEDHGDAGPR